VALLPPLIWFAIRMIPPEAMAEWRHAAEAAGAKRCSRLGLAIVVAIWLLAAALFLRRVMGGG
jgi:hypothetical protein